MKTYFSILFLIGLINFSFSQKIHFGAIIGYNNSTARYKQSDNIMTMSIAGLQAGAYGSINFKKSVSISADLLYNQKGNLVDDSRNYADYGKRSTLKFNYIDLVLRVNYKWFSKNKFLISTGIGSYFGYGLNGTEKGFTYSLYGTSPFERKVTFKTSDNTRIAYFKPTEIGGVFNTTFKYKRYLLYANYSHAFNDRHFINGWDYEARNNVFSVGFGCQIK